MSVRMLVLLNDNWDTDTKLKIFDSNEIQIYTLAVEILLQYYPILLDSKVQHFSGNNIYLK